MPELDAKQLEGIERALQHDGYIFTMQPRVGKTRPALVVASRRKLAKLLVVCPKSIFHVWTNGFAEFPELDGVDKRIVNFEQFNTAKSRRKLRKWLEGRRSMVIGDEIHRIKKRTSRQSKGLRFLARGATYRLGLTGTLIGQNVHDAWAIFDFADPKIFGKWATFQENYLVMGGWMGKKIIDYKNLPDFQEIVAEYSFRVKLSEVSETPIRIRRTFERVKLGADAMRHYRHLERHLYTETRGLRVEAPLVITLTQKLQQITGGFLVSKDRIERIDRSKERVTIAQLEQRRVPTMVVFKYVHELEAIEERVLRMGRSVRVVRGGQPLDTPFVEDVALMQIQSGFGIDLSAADLVIFYSWDHSQINFEQVRFRVLSRKRTRVQYLFIMAENTVDELVYEAVARKRKLADVVYNHYRRLDDERPTRESSRRDQEGHG